MQDFWGDYGTSSEILLRNLQEIAKPLGDPYPVSLYRGAQYEYTDACMFELQPQYIGKTTRPFPNTQITSIFNLNPGIGQMQIGCTFFVR